MSVFCEENRSVDSCVGESCLSPNDQKYKTNNKDMKTQILAFAMTMCMAGTFFTSCETAAQKEEAAEANVQDAGQELKEAQQVALTAARKVATAEEWNAFKVETEAKIDKNEVRIGELRVKLNKPGKTFDKAIANRIDTLEQQNKDLRIRLADYKQNQSDWDSFKREFNHDMDELGKALTDFTVNNKN
jgi:hypothetical protein